MGWGSSGRWTMILLVGLAACGRAGVMGLEQGALSIDRGTLGPVDVGQAFRFDLVVRGGRSPYQWTVPLQSELPDGTRLVDSRLSGASTVAGIFSFGVRVTDRLGARAEARLTLEVRPLPSEPTIGLMRIVSRIPGLEEHGVAPTTVISVTFDRPVDSRTVNESTLVLREEGRDVRLRGRLTVEGPRVTLTPAMPLRAGTRHLVELGPNLSAVSGERLRPSELRRWAFSTAGPSSSAIEIGGAADRIRYVPEQERLYVLNTEDRRLVVVELVAKVVLECFQLLNVPDDVCIDPGHESAWIVNQGSTSIVQLDLRTGALVRTIEWPAPEWGGGGGDRLPHFHIHCLQDELLVVDGTWAPSLWTVSLAQPAVVTNHSDSVDSIGDLKLSADGRGFYYWHQYGWSAGWAGTNVYRVERQAGGGFEVVDESEIGYPAGARDPLDSPIFVDEARQLIIVKRFILDAQNLRGVRFTLGEDEEIYAADLARGRIASKRTIYGLERYEAIRAVPIANPDQLFFDGAGTLYMLEAAAGRLSYTAVP